MLEFNFSVAEESDGPAHISVEVTREMTPVERFSANMEFGPARTRTVCGKLYATLAPGGSGWEIWDELYENPNSPPVHTVPTQEDFVLWVMFEVEPGAWTAKEGGE